MSEKATVWSVAQAKARLSEVIDRAREQGPQTITKMAALRVVVVSIEERTRKTKRKGHARRLLRGVSTAPFWPRDRACSRRNPRGRFVSRGWLIDTNIVSESVKPRPDAGIVGWLDEADADRIFLGVVSLAKIRLGVERLAPGRRRNRLDLWLRDELPARFEGRVVPVNEQVRRRLRPPVGTSSGGPAAASGQWML